MSRIILGITIFIVIPHAASLLDCDDEPFWRSYRLAVSDCVREQDPVCLTSADSEIVQASSQIIKEFADRISSFSSSKDEWLSKGSLEWILEANLQTARPDQFCLYGVVTALFVSAANSFEMHEHGKHLEQLEKANLLLGSETKRNLDFLEDANFGIRSVDILVNLDNPHEFLFPWLVRQRYSVPSNRAPILQTALSDVKPPQGVQNRGIKVWELGVHASLSAEALNIVYRVINVTSHRRLIQAQYPAALNSICTEMYSRIPCDQTRDNITLFFERYLPYSATSSEPPEGADDMKLRFLELLRGRLDLPDLFICTVPWLCLLVAELQIPIIGYFGHPVPFMVKREKQQEFLSAIRDLASLPAVQLVVTDPFLRMQYEYQLGIQIPFIRVSGAYLSITEQPKYMSDILVWDRPFDMALMGVVQAVLSAGAETGRLNSKEVNPNEHLPELKTDDDVFIRVAKLDHYPFRFLTRHALVDRSYNELSRFKALVLFPYDMDLVCFYEFYAIGIPIFIPSSIEKYVFFQQHLKYDGRHHGNDQIERDIDDHERIPSWPLEGLSPLNESNVEVTAAQLEYADYLKFPGIRTFDNISDLLHQLSIDNFENTEQVNFYREESERGELAWSEIVSRVMG